MKTVIGLCAMLLVGCAQSGEGYSVESEADSGNKDAALDTAIVDAGQLCCQVVDNETDDPIWHSGLYICNQPHQVPWICGSNLACDDPSCVAGMPCVAFNGSGYTLYCEGDK